MMDLKSIWTNLSYVTVKVSTAVCIYILSRRAAAKLRDAWMIASGQGCINWSLQSATHQDNSTSDFFFLNRYSPWKPVTTKQLSASRTMMPDCKLCLLLKERKGTVHALDAKLFFGLPIVRTKHGSLFTLLHFCFVIKCSNSLLISAKHHLKERSHETTTKESASNVCTSNDLTFMA